MEKEEQERILYGFNGDPWFGPQDFIMVFPFLGPSPSEALGCVRVCYKNHVLPRTSTLQCQGFIWPKDFVVVISLLK